MLSERLAIFLGDLDRLCAKSDIGAAVGQSRLLGLYRAMLLDTLAVCLHLPKIDIAVYHDARLGVSADFDRQLEGLLQAHGQQFRPAMRSHTTFRANNKGRRVVRPQGIFKQSFEEGFKRVILLKGNCPMVDSSLLKAAFAMLRRSDVVIGPSFDGGFYVLGMSRYFPMPDMRDDQPGAGGYPLFKMALERAGAVVQELELSYQVISCEDLNQLIDDIERLRRIGDNQTASFTERFLTELT